MEKSSEQQAGVRLPSVGERYRVWNPYTETVTRVEVEEMDDRFIPFKAICRVLETTDPELENGVLILLADSGVITGTPRYIDVSGGYVDRNGYEDKLPECRAYPDGAVVDLFGSEPPTLRRQWIDFVTTVRFLHSITFGKYRNSLREWTPGMPREATRNGDSPIGIAVNDLALILKLISKLASADVDLVRGLAIDQSNAEWQRQVARAPELEPIAQRDWRYTISEWQDVDWNELSRSEAAAVVAMANVDGFRLSVTANGVVTWDHEDSKTFGLFALDENDQESSKYAERFNKVHGTSQSPRLCSLLFLPGMSLQWRIFFRGCSLLLAVTFGLLGSWLAVLSMIRGEPASSVALALAGGGVIGLLCVRFCFNISRKRL